MAECAILAIASTTRTVYALLQRLVKDVVLDEHASVVPWTIVNKYYTAEVKILVHPLSSWNLIQDVHFVPALLFVWNSGDSYRDQVHELSIHASQHEFEVALAVRLPSISSVLPAEVEDDQDIDAYLSSMGFEFVDVTDAKTLSPDRMGIPGIPRIVDALSTIMWPSMVRQTSKRATTAGFAGTTRTNLGDDYHNLARLVGEKISRNDDGHIQRELEELERWFDEDALSSDIDARSADGGDDAIPWSTAVTPGTLSPSLTGFLENSRSATPETGFDDDFTSFVCASSETSAGVPPTSLDSRPSLPTFPPFTSASFSSTFSFESTSSGRSTPVFDDCAGFDTSCLAPGKAYKSLGSVSDFGDPDKDLVHLERLSTESDDDMPTQAEIARTSHKVFGSLPLLPSPMQERGDKSIHPSGLLGQSALLGCPGEAVDVEMADADLERFDLQNVLGALQGLKEEIAGMPDKKRRKAAARVALGLAYGLSGDPRSEELA